MTLFGTDGIRGVANLDLTPELAYRVGRAGASVLASTSAPERPIVVGRDTRLSGTMLEAAIVAGITSVGRDALLVGVVPTPGVAKIVALVGAAAGVMISASHNPIEDNGIKFFAADGYKLADRDEEAIEALLGADDLPRPTHGGVGIAREARALASHYRETLVAGGESLAGWTVVVDGAFGAAYEIAPDALRALGATVIAINCEPDGTRINVACGATDLRALANAVREHRNGRVVGVAFDGDADRALFVDERGETLSGDHAMLALGRERKRRGALPGDTVVGTVMSNAGLERAFRDESITLVRAPVGDRYVLAEMRARGLLFGGEQSGHVIDLDRNTTGDGPMTAITLLSIAAREKTTLRELTAALVVYPQILVNVRTHDRNVHETNVAVRASIAQGERALDGDGRILVRASGTEPLVRVMVEGRDDALIAQVAQRIADSIKSATGS